MTLFRKLREEVERSFLCLLPHYVQLLEEYDYSVELKSRNKNNDCQRLSENNKNATFFTSTFEYSGTSSAFETDSE